MWYVRIVEHGFITVLQFTDEHEARAAFWTAGRRPEVRFVSLMRRSQTNRSS